MIMKRIILSVWFNLGGFLDYDAFIFMTNFSEPRNL